MIMTTSEHLIENAIGFLEEHKENCYENFMENKLIQEQAKFVGISMRDIWLIAQYVCCVYKPFIRMQVEDEMVERYGYGVEAWGE